MKSAGRARSVRFLRTAVAAATALAAAGAQGCGAEGPDGSHEGGEVGTPSLRPLVRPDTPGNGLLFNFEPGDVVETFGSPGGQFVVHFTRNGPNAVPDDDDDASGVPDFVEQVAAVYDEVLVTYTEDLGFRAPLGDLEYADNGGDGRFDVYLVDFAGKGDGNYQNESKCVKGNPDQCPGYMVQENDFAGYGYPSTLIANRILGSHELFHAVQAAYDREQGSVLAEGTAVWATETFDPSLDDFEWFLDGYFENPDRSLDVPLPGAVDPFSYGSAIFFRFLSEKHSHVAVRELLERTENGAAGAADPYWLDAIDGALSEAAGTGFADAFTKFAIWNLFTDDHADPSRSYQNGADYPRVKTDEVAAPFVDEKLRVFYASSQYYRASPAGRADMTAVLVPPADDPAALDGLTLHLAVEKDGQYASVVTASDPASVTPVDTGDADGLVVLVVNTNRAGDSKRPGLCIGSPDEALACRDALLGGGGAGGSGAGGAGGGPGTGGSTGADADAGRPGPGGNETAGVGAPGEDSGCGCFWVGARGRGPLGWAHAAVLAAALAWARRRR